MSEPRVGLAADRDPHAHDGRAGVAPVRSIARTASSARASAVSSSARLDAPAERMPAEARGLVGEPVIEGDWLDALARLRAAGEPAVIATLVHVRGHAPREAGAKMIVGRRGVWSTIGGGNLEATAIQRARELLRDRGAVPEELELGLSEHARADHGEQCCGGVVRILLEPVAAAPTVAIFGVGHVGLELARIVTRMPWRVHLVDAREGMFAPERLGEILTGAATVSLHSGPAPEQVVAGLPEGAHALILTHDHAEDFLLCDAVLRRDAELRAEAEEAADAGEDGGDVAGGEALADTGVRGGLGSMGVIGSAAKWARFRGRLASEGHADEEIARLRCPIGIQGIGGKEPVAVAVSVAAELLELVRR